MGLFSTFDQSPFSTAEEWASVLVFAHDYGFDSVRKLAMRFFFPLASSVEKIVYGRRCEVPGWLLDAFIDLCARASALELEEAQRLHMADVVNISALRQNVLLGIISKASIRREVWRVCCSHIQDEKLTEEDLNLANAKHDPELQAKSNVSDAEAQVESVQAAYDRLEELLREKEDRLKAARQAQYLLGEEYRLECEAKAEKAELERIAAQKAEEEAQAKRRQEQEDKERRRIEADAARRRADEENSVARREAERSAALAEQRLAEEQVVRKRHEANALQWQRSNRELEATVSDLKKQLAKAEANVMRLRPSRGEGTDQGQTHRASYPRS
jgi:hypothetical protein